MNETKHSNSAHGGLNPDGLHHVHSPYWKRAHHDWRFWVAAFLIFAAMIFYVITVEFSLPPRSQPLPPNLNTIGK
jgi:hypothetical protein